MKDDQIVNSLSQGRRDFAKVEGATGTLYKKQIIKFGDYVDPWFPEWPMTLDAEWGTMIKDNFDKKTVGRVAVPASHTDDPEKNRGEVLHIEQDAEGLNGTLDIRDPQTVQDIENNLIWDDSISFTNNYIDEKGIGHGPVLFHVALVNNPYITGMTGFQALSKAVNHVRFAFSQKHNGSAIVLSKKVKELSNMKPIKNEKEFDVEVNYQDAEGKDIKVTVKPGEEIEVPEATEEAVKQQIESAEAPIVEETDEEKTAREAQEAEDAEAAKGDVTTTPPADTTVDNDDKGGEAVTTTDNPENTAAADLSKADRAELEALRTEKAETMFSKLVDEGKVVPAQKEAIIGLAKTSGADAVAKMFSNAPKVIDFSEKGSQTEHKDDKTSATEASKEDVKQWSDLSQVEQDTQKTLGVSEKMYNDTALANPQYYRKEAK